jgi:hypothetical protein
VPRGTQASGSERICNRRWRDGDQQRLAGRRLAGEGAPAARHDEGEEAGSISHGSGKKETRKIQGNDKTKTRQG